MRRELFTVIFIVITLVAFDGFSFVPLDKFVVKFWKIQNRDAGFVVIPYRRERCFLFFDTFILLIGLP
jgi:hypothetical protein